MNQELEKLVAEFRAAISQAKENPLLENLDTYEDLIAGNAEEGHLEAARRHAELLTEFYIDENPFKRPGESERMEAVKDSNPELYQAMDATKRALAVGIAAEKVANYISGLQ